jgi:hypothetical protein
MSDSVQNQPCILGCRVPVPAELVTEGLCVVHFLLGAEKACAEMRHETASGSLCPKRRAEIEKYAAMSAMKLACLATGSLRIPDETKMRILTTFLTLMILRENLDRVTSKFVPWLHNPLSIKTTAEVAAVS